MTIRYSYLGEPLASEVTTALLDLASVERRMGWAAFERLEGVAYEMLKLVLKLCEAERGAFLLRDESFPLEQAEAGPSGTTDARMLRPLALHNIDADEVSLLISAASEQTAPSSEMTCWLAFRLALTESDDGEVHDRVTLPLAPALDLEKRAQHALLVLGWDADQDSESAECAERMQRCHALLPLVANAIGSGINSILLKERAHELEQRSVREALEGMELLKAELLGTVSHELRGPLASIKGYAATLLRHERRLAREERHQFLLAINEASDRLEVIIERLLEVSQLETGQITIERSPVDVAYLAGEAIAAAEGRLASVIAGRFTFQLQVEHADGSPAHTAPLILADPRHLREVLDNLLENAVKYSPEGGMVRVTLRPIEEAHASPNVWRKMLEISVCDSGQGIPSEHLERIFDRFHRVDTRLTREVNGPGLGLTICKRIVELHGGTIWAENRPHSRGSAFYIRLPIDGIDDFIAYS